MYYFLLKDNPVIKMFHSKNGPHSLLEAIAPLIIPDVILCIGVYFYKLKKLFGKYC